MTTGVILLNFGEPAEPTRDAVVPYLERIFYQNRFLEDDLSDAEARERSQELAERRAPGLMAEYEVIGGSPLNEQSATQVEAVEAILRERGHDVTAYLGTQFADPTIGDAVEAARADSVDRLVGLPVYPLCGPSTTIAALSDLERLVADASWNVPVEKVSGWHRHPAYTRLRAANVRAFANEEGVDLAADDTLVAFSAHGTPIHYLKEGSRYDAYVEEYTDALAAMLGIDDAIVGYQNHENRDIPWTGPETEDVVLEGEAERVIVEPVSFMHEQSETLSELDVELREIVEDAGRAFHRVPVPHDDSRFSELLADLIEPFVAGFDPSYANLRTCQCANGDETVCLNAPRTSAEQP